LIKRLLMDWR